MLLDNMEDYLNNTEEGNQNMLIAANYAGQAINITQTTAAHAMSYKLTSLYGIPHGRAAFICLPCVWKYMWEHIDTMPSEAGQDLVEVLEEIAQTLHCKSVPEALEYITILNKKLFQENKITMNSKDVALLAASVNLTRLKNNPMVLSEQTLHDMYNTIVKFYN